MTKPVSPGIINFQKTASGEFRVTSPTNEKYTSTPSSDDTFSFLDGDTLMSEFDRFEKDDLMKDDHCASSGSSSSSMAMQSSDKTLSKDDFFNLLLKDAYDDALEVLEQLVPLASALQKNNEYSKKSKIFDDQWIVKQFETLLLNDKDPNRCAKVQIMSYALRNRCLGEKYAILFQAISHFMTNEAHVAKNCAESFLKLPISPLEMLLAYKTVTEGQLSKLINSNPILSQFFKGIEISIQKRRLSEQSINLSQSNMKA